VKFAGCIGLPNARRAGEVLYHLSQGGKTYYELASLMNVSLATAIALTRTLKAYDLVEIDQITPVVRRKGRYKHVIMLKKERFLTLLDKCISSLEKLRNQI